MKRYVRSPQQKQNTCGFSFDFIWYANYYDQNEVQGIVEDAFTSLGYEVLRVDFNLYFSGDYSMYPQYRGKQIRQCSVDFIWYDHCDQAKIVNTIADELATAGYEVIGSDFYSL